MFPSSLKGSPQFTRSDNLNATQQKSSSHPLFSTIEQELHDARRVHSHGLEDDLRSALSMVIDRVGELSSLLSEAYKTQADLETQLNLAKSNLKLVIANNEMLEEALRHGSVNGRDVGWRRRSGKEHDVAHSDHRAHSIDLPIGAREEIEAPLPTSPPPQDRSFFKFRFSGSTSNGGSKAVPVGRPETPSGSALSAQSQQHSLAGLASPSLPSIPAHVKEVEDLTTELERERKAHQKAESDRVALEAELESLSQALFEEANKMVASERIKRAEMEEELKEALKEKEALRSALRLVEGENIHLRSSTASPAGSADSSPIIPFSISNSSKSATSTLSVQRPRSSSQVGIKSNPGSPGSMNTPLPPRRNLPSASGSRPVSPASVHIPDSPPLETGASSQALDSPKTPATPLSAEDDPSDASTFVYSRLAPDTSPEATESPWADVSSASPGIGTQRTPKAQPLSQPGGTISAAELLAMR